MCNSANTTYHNRTNGLLVLREIGEREEGKREREER
jgi:hypothetical protein